MHRTVRRHIRIPALGILLLAMLLAGCRSSEPPPEKKSATQVISEASTPTPSPAGPATSVGEPRESVIAPSPIAAGEPESSSPATPPTKAPQFVSAPPPSRPLIAIIIDDMGHHQQLGHQFLSLDLNLSYSFLPDAPYSGALAEAAFALGRDILVHLPMEPKNGIWADGEGGLAVRDTPDQIKQKTTRMLAAVPHAVGASNHMGSRFTEDNEAIRAVLTIIKSRDFLFIDSYTTVASQGLVAAQQLGVPSARRHVFLDNVQELPKICRQLDHLVAMAQQQGWAIGIGHPYRTTLAALTQCDRKQLNKVDMVGVSRLVR